MKRDRVPALDGIRGFAALWVFLFHYLQGEHSSIAPVRWLWTANQAGWAAVSLFFVLSGFLITGILWDSFQGPHWWRNFYVRRSLRIFPLYYLTILIAIVLFFTVGHGVGSIRHLWIYATYLQDVPTLGGVGGKLPDAFTVGHLWSLAVEEQFYFLWPPLLYLFAKSRRSAMICAIVLILASFAYRLTICHVFHLEDSAAWGERSLPGRAGDLLLGALLALYLKGSRESIERLYRVLPWILGSTFVGVVIMWSITQNPYPTEPPMLTTGILLWSMFFAAMIAASLRPGVFQTIFSSRTLRWMGTISYGFYVFHMLFVSEFDQLTAMIVPASSKTAYSIVRLFVVLICTLVLASVSFYCFEKPFLRIKQRFEPRSISVVPEAVISPAEVSDYR